MAVTLTSSTAEDLREFWLLRGDSNGRHDSESHRDSNELGIAFVTSTIMSGNGAHNRRLPNKEGAAFLWSLYEHADVGVVQVAADGKLKWVNAALCRMLGYSQKELLDKAFEDIVPPRDRARQTKLIHKILTRKYACHDAEEHFLHRTGTHVSAVVTSLLVNGSGTESYCTNLVRDVSEPSITDMTDHNRTLRSLQESEERFRTIFNDAPAGMSLSSTNGRFIFVNTALCDFLGYSRNELSAKDLLAVTYLEDKEDTLRQLTGLESGDIARTREEHRFVHKNGQILWGDVRRSLIRDSQTGKPKYIVSQILDITDRRRMEQSLRETEERFRTIADSAPVLIWMAGPDKARTYFNRGWLDFTGRSLEEEFGDGWIQRVHPHDVSNLLESYRNSSDQRVPSTLSYRIRRHDGEYRWLVDTGAPRFNPDGSFAGYIGSCIDETDRRTAEEVLRNISRKLIEAQEKERKRIARELHDDINQRLAMLAIELQQLDSSPVFPARRHERVERLLKRITEISSDLQALSHELHSVTLEHLGIAAAMRSFCNDLARHQKVNVEFVEKALPAWIPPDVALALLRVLQEGVHNAVKHSGVRKIFVELMGNGDSIQLTIRDFGVGFDLERAAKGEGLGLLSMKERVLPFKGTLLITSKPKHGTELVVRIPIRTDAISNAS